MLPILVVAYLGVPNDIPHIAKIKIDQNTSPNFGYMVQNCWKKIGFLKTFYSTHSQNQNRPKWQNTSPNFGYVVQKC